MDEKNFGSEYITDVISSQQGFNNIFKHEICIKLIFIKVQKCYNNLQINK